MAINSDTAPGIEAVDHRQNGKGAFTLIELMAVVLVILLLAGLTLGVASYVQKRMAVSNAKSQIAAIESALENYKSDWGYYPATAPGRISAGGFREATNNVILYKALSGGAGKVYLKFQTGQLKTNSLVAPQLNIYDPWGSPYMYYNSPGTSSSVANLVAPNVYNNGYTLGGQVNVASYDLMSYGSDRVTFVPGSFGFSFTNAAGYYPWYYGGWTSTNSALDDITNFGR